MKRPDAEKSRIIALPALIRFREFGAVPTAACANHCGSYSALPEAFAKLCACIEEYGYKIVGSSRFCI